jgi:hypothetical protein
MLVLVAPRQLQIFARCLLRFLDETMQQNHPAFPVDIEKYARDSVLTQARPHFVDAVAERLAYGHANGPAELHGLDILSDALPILGRKPFQPFATGSPPASVR